MTSVDHSNFLDNLNVGHFDDSIKYDDDEGNSLLEYIGPDQLYVVIVANVVRTVEI